MEDKDGTNIFWTRQKKIILVISLVVIILGGSLAISYLLQPPSFEDNLIKAHESGSDSATLISSIEDHYNAEVRLTDANKDAQIGLAKYEVDSGQLTATDAQNKINTINSNYPKMINNLESIKELEIAYVNGQLSAEDLKKSIEAINQQSKR